MLPLRLSESEYIAFVAIEILIYCLFMAIKICISKERKNGKIVNLHGITKRINCP